jgi:putative inorganic carbon (hco3(-)) transporter
MRDLLLLTLTAICALLAVRRPVYGIIAYISYSFLAPHSFAWGIARTFPHVHVIALCTLAGLISTGWRQLPKQREIFLLLALWGAFAVSTVFAIESERAMTQLFHVSKVLLMVFVSLYLIDSAQKLRWLVRAIALSIGFYGLKIGLFVMTTGGQEAVFGPSGSFLEANNSLGMALAVNVPLLFYLATVEESVWLRRLMNTMLGLSYPAVLGTFSRGAWVALATVTLFMMIKSKKRFLGIALIGVVVVSSPLWFSRVFSTQMSSRFDTLRNYEGDSSAQSRFWNWEFCTRVGLARPLHGAGFDYYSLRAYAIYFPEFVQRWPDKVWSCHNMWLSVFSEHGLLGLSLWLWLLACFWSTLRRIERVAPRKQSTEWLLPYSSMLEAALIAYVVSGTFLDVAYFELYYFLIVIAVVAKRLLEQQYSTEDVALAKASYVFES